MSKEVATELVGAALALRDAGDDEGAERVLREAIAEDPKHAKAWWFLGGLYWTREKYDESVVYFAEACRLRPRVEDCSFGLFRSLADAGYEKRATAEARRFLLEVADGAKCSEETRLEYEAWLASDPTS